MDNDGTQAHSRAQVLLAAAALALLVNAGFAYTIAAIPTQGQRYFAALLMAPDDTDARIASTHSNRLKS